MLLLNPMVNSTQTQLSQGWLRCVWGVRAGGPFEMGRFVANWPCLSSPPSAVYFLKKAATNRAVFSIPWPIRRPTRHPEVDSDMVDLLDQYGRSNLTHPLQFDQGIQAPTGCNSPLKCTPLNEATAPSPCRIRPHPNTRTSTMVLWWGWHGGFVLSHPEASLESMGGWWWGAHYSWCEWIMSVLSSCHPVDVGCT